MKSSLAIIAILFAFMATSCQSNVKSDADATAEGTTINAANVVKVELKVEGMTCEGCEKAIKGNVETLPGVVSVAASHTLANAVVAYDKTLCTAEQIAEKITEKQFAVVSQAEVQ